MTSGFLLGLHAQQQLSQSQSHEQTGSAAEASGRLVHKNTPVSVSRTRVHSSQMAISPVGWTQNSTIQTSRGVLLKDHTLF